MRLRHRLFTLLGAIGTGVAAGTVGHLVTGSQWWFAAVPVCVAAAWFFVADPTQCTAAERPPAARRPR
ncbi:MAG TPA: hypothetical protein VFQ16_05190 [Burkholderiaceae bacterium]|nr:hypothetical protein [Burkholderiaceae bacterium]